MLSAGFATFSIFTFLSPVGVIVSFFATVSAVVSITNLEIPIIPYPLIAVIAHLLFTAISLMFYSIIDFRIFSFIGNGFALTVLFIGLIVSVNKAFKKGKELENPQMKRMQESMERRFD